MGSLAQRGARSRATIQELLSEARGRALVVFDVNLRPPIVDPDVIDATIRAADVVKLGAAELDHLGELLERPALVEWLLTDVGLRAVCVTYGARGASVTTTSGTVTVPGIALDGTAGDPVGAGDAFTAALTHGLVREVAPEAALAAANRYAALVASKPGAMPLLSEEELAGVQ